MRNSRSVALTVWMAVAAVGGSSLAPLKPMLEHAAPSVVRVEARDCTSPGIGATERTATGFVWRDKDTVVTALHVVNSCGNVGVVYQVPNTLARTARVIKVLRRADLALLRISGAPVVQPLNVEAQAPSMEDKLEALGFPLQIPKMNSTTLSLRFGGSKLEDIVPRTVKDSLVEYGSPDPGLEITDIEGHLLPGLSGAPILNVAGNVVAVGDGGLENGMVGISWGIPARMLQQLAASQEGDTGGGRRSGNLFAAENEAKVMGTATCSGYELTKVRTVRFEQIAATTDDPLGLQQLLNYFRVNPSVLAFDVYQHLPSGATVAVPAGATLQDGAQGCTASIHGGDFVLRIALAQVNNLADVQSKSMQMERDSIDGNSQGWMVDPSFTYAAPVPRFDGLLVRRRAYAHMNPALMSPDSLPQDRYLFETIAARRTMLIEASGLNNISTIQNNKAAVMCRLNPAMQDCERINARTDDWVKVVIAVHLATFPVG